MTSQTNKFGQPVGDALPDWQGAQFPPQTMMSGRYCRVEPLNSEVHAADLFAAISADQEGKLWTYMASGPFISEDEFRLWLDQVSDSRDPLFHAIVDNISNKALGLCSYLRIKPAVGVIEVGGITYSPALQQTAMATEAMYLMMARVFDDLGYRRYEWKCDALNEPSRRAAQRLGFKFEGTFAQALVYKGRNRDTAWFAMLDREWPDLKMAYQKWLDKDNFTPSGKQKQALNHFLGNAGNG